MIRHALAAILLMRAVGVAAQPESPDWNELSAHQQQVLAPVSSEWNRYAPMHKHQLLALIPAYDQLDSQQQHRFALRLKSWSDLTEQQQAQIRQHWQTLQKMPAAKRAEVLAKLRAVPHAAHDTGTFP